MKLVKAWEEQGVDIPAPYCRCLKVLFAPDKDGVEELTFSHALLPSNGRTDYHEHDRPEMIYVVTGSGTCLNEGEEVPITEDVVMWIPAGEKHQIINTGSTQMKLATIFVPAYKARDLYARCLGRMVGSGTV